jgi:starvation-inducible DNA-binding protein
MLDPQVEAVQLMVDATAERISTQAHLGALDMAYGGVVEGHREAIEKTETIDPVTQDLLIDQSGELEQFHWFVRAHLETPDGVLVTEGAKSETSAAKMASSKTANGRTRAARSR